KKWLKHGTKSRSQNLTELLGQNTKSGGFESKKQGGNLLQSGVSLRCRLLAGTPTIASKLVSGFTLRCFGLWPLHDTTWWIDIAMWWQIS
ncbi:MAG TPA: hypothetical protein PKD78_07805, partial [Saprospiraceae bacterium]|nr:hypothetical protein [Saprospiraceae bacterium]